MDIWICLKIYPRSCLNMGNYEILECPVLKEKQIITLKTLTNLAFAQISDHQTQVQQITYGLREFASMDIVTFLNFFVSWAPSFDPLPT